MGKLAATIVYPTRTTSRIKWRINLSSPLALFVINASKISFQHDAGWSEQNSNNKSSRLYITMPIGGAMDTLLVFWECPIMSFSIE